MHLRQIFAGLMGLASLAAAAPAAVDESQAAPEKGLKWKTRAQKRAPLIIQQNIQETSITIVEQNLDQVNQLQLLAEQQFGALVQAELALITQAETIKNNIRLNHFKSRFSQVNTVIVTVTQVMDVRDSSNINKRYLINQLLADNGFPDKEVLVMVSALEVMTISLPTPTLDVGGILGSLLTAAASTATPVFAGFDPNAPFGNINESLVLPFGSAAPSNALIFADPAAIILEGQSNLFVESSDNFVQDCSFYSNNNNAFFNWASQLFTSFTQIISVQTVPVTLTGAVVSGSDAFSSEGK